MRFFRLLPLALLLVLLGGCTAPTAPEPAAVASDVWLLEVAEEGAVWLSPTLLRSVGLDPQTDELSSLRLSHAEDSIPYLPLQTVEGWGALFYAPPLTTRHAQRSAFRLEVGAAGMSMETRTEMAASPVAPVGADAAWHTVAQEQELRYLPQATAEVPWFWEPLYAPGELSYAAVLTDALPGPITATVRLWSHTSFQPYPDHHAILKWDGEPVGEWEWNGQGMQTLTASWEVAQPGDKHSLSIETPATSEMGVAVIWFDSWELTYRRQIARGLCVAEGDALAVDDPAARTLDVTAPFAPIADVSEAGSVAAQPGHRYWIGAPEQAQAPLVVRPAERLPDLADISYLAIAPAAFHPALEPLLEYRRAEGLSVTVVTPQAVYDTFGSGQSDPAAIQALARALPTLRYLLLVGDATTAPDAYTGEAGALRVVVPFTRTSVLGETPADALYSLAANGTPRVAVGRFPVESPEQVAALVAKTLWWENEGAVPVPVLLNDDESEFVNALDAFAPLIPGGETAARIDAGDADGREALLGALGRRCTWLNYAGHGSLRQLGDEGVLQIDDGAAWQDPTLVVAWTCLAAHFTHEQQPSMAEVWLRLPEGGAVAFLGPVGETTTFEQRPFAEAFYAALPEVERIGDAWLQALQVEMGSDDVRYGFVLLGDPALRVLSE